MGRSQTFVAYACANWGAAGLGAAAVWAGLPTLSAVVLALGAMVAATYFVTPETRRGQLLRIAGVVGLAMVSMVFGVTLAFMANSMWTAFQATQLIHSNDPAAIGRMLVIGADNEANGFIRAFGFGVVFGLISFWFRLPNVAPQPTYEEEGPPAWTKIL